MWWKVDRPNGPSAKAILVTFLLPVYADSGLWTSL